MKVYNCTGNPEEVVKRAMYKAWNACGNPVGMGVFQDKPDATEEEVWDNVKNKGDYPGPPQSRSDIMNADYVFGRMMKLRLSYNENGVHFPENEPSPDYQGWALKYPSYEELLVEADTEVTPSTEL